MPSKNIKRKGLLFDEYGALIREVHSENDKCYAVIAKCGHCGDGYFIPIMFTEKCKDIQNAIELVKATPMVKRDRKDCILEAFEITSFEKFCIESVNAHDPYLKGYLRKKTIEIDERKVINEETIKNPIESDFKHFNIKTADEYSSNYVLERYFAPYFLGSDLIFPKKVDTQQLLHDFIQRACIRYGMKKENPFFLGLYYRLYGEDNDLNIIKEKNYFYFNKYGEIISCEIPDSLIGPIEYRAQLIEENSSENEVAEEYFSGKLFERKTQTEKFNDRMKKHQDKINPGQEPERE